MEPDDLLDERILVNYDRVWSVCLSQRVSAMAQRTHARLMRERSVTMARSMVATRALVALKREAIVASEARSRTVSDAPDKILSALRGSSPLCLRCVSDHTGLDKWRLHRAIFDLISGRKLLAKPSTRCCACRRLAYVAQLLPYALTTPTAAGGSRDDVGV